MAGERTDANTVSPRGAAASTQRGDVPEAIRRRYYSQMRGGALGFYADAEIKSPAFQDRGARLAAPRATPQALRDMTEIARHRGWSVVVVQGSRTFRREAWLAGEAAGLEVRGYRPTVRDRQALERQLERGRRGRAAETAPERKSAPPIRDAHAAARLELVSRIVRRRVDDPVARDRILSAARARIADWLERGAQFRPMPPSDRRTDLKRGSRRPPER